MKQELKRRFTIQDAKTLGVSAASEKAMGMNKAQSSEDQIKMFNVGPGVFKNLAQRGKTKDQTLDRSGITMQSTIALDTDTQTD